MSEVEPGTRVGKREDAASSYYPEEWPEEFVSHGARATNTAVFGERSGLPFIRTDRGLNVTH